jgi:uncharacterized protein YoxC
MATLIHADIFFFVTTIVVVVVGIALTVALIYLAKVLSDLRKITKEVHEETVLFREDLKNLRTDVRREGFKLWRLVDFGKQFFERKKTSRSKKES